MIVALILAGGVGARLGKGIPKQFVEVLGKPIMAYTLEKYQNHPMIDAIEIVSHKDYFDDCKAIVEKYGITKAKWYVSGGDSYPASTLNGIKALEPYLQDDDIVMIHGSCAPVFTEEMITDAIRVCSEHKSAMAVQQMIWSTCLKDDEEISSKTIDRESIVQVQFPLTFQYRYISDCYDKVIADGSFEKLGLHLQYTVFANGGKMYFSKGDGRNIKITTQAELDIFEGLVLLEQKKEGKKC